MARINLWIDDDLFAKIEKEAVGKSTTVNLLIIDLLENLYEDIAAFNYSEALKTLVGEAENFAKNHQTGDEFPARQIRLVYRYLCSTSGKSEVAAFNGSSEIGKNV